MNNFLDLMELVAAVAVITGLSFLTAVALYAWLVTGDFELGTFGAVALPVSAIAVAQ
jgi:hypothetical protein